MSPRDMAIEIDRLLYSDESWFRRWSDEEYRHEVRIRVAFLNAVILHRLISEKP